MNISPNPNRKIIHIDMDAFFAAVEQRDHPDLRGKPIAVGGMSKRGVVAAASYEARKFGVRSAMPSATASRLCPELIFVRHNFEVYREVSYQIREIFFQYTDLVEPLSLDEAFLDVTQNHVGQPSATLIAEEIRKKIFQQTQLTASAGVSFNKFLAKVASDVNKPNGIKVIPPEESAEFLEKLPIERFFGVGKVTAKKMHQKGIRKGKDLKSHPEEILTKWFGKSGRYFFHCVRGNDTRPVNPERIRKSIGAERTFFENLDSVDQMKEKLGSISENLFRTIAKKKAFGRTITLKAKTPEFQIITRSKSFHQSVRTEEEFKRVVFELVDKHWKDFQTVRLLGVSVSNLDTDLPEKKQLVLPFLQDPL